MAEVFVPGAWVLLGMEYLSFLRLLQKSPPPTPVS